MELEELQKRWLFTSMYLNKQTRLSDTFCIFIIFSLYISKTRKKNKWVWPGNTTIIHCRPRPGLILLCILYNNGINSISNANYMRKMCVRFSTFCPQCCRTARERFCCLLCWGDTLQVESSILLMGGAAYDARFSVCNKRNALRYSHRT